MVSKAELIEVQYEIAMAIGSSLDLKKMFRTSLSAILRKLTCPVGGFLRTVHTSDNKVTLSPIFSIPIHAEKLEHIREALQPVIKSYLVSKYAEFVDSLPVKINLVSGGSVHLLELPDFGVLYLHTSEDFLDIEFIRALVPLMQKLAIASKACIQNKQVHSINQQISEKNHIIQEQNKELKQALENLKATQSQLIHSEKMASLGVLTNGVAHEINNPLNYISGSYLGLEKYFAGSSEISKENIPFFLSSIQKGLERITNIVKGLNEFSSDNNNYDEECDLHLILDNCIAMVQGQLNYKVSVVKNFTKNSLPITGNVGQLHQAFINVLSNAIHSITDEGTIEIETALNQDEVEIFFIDSGCGISEEDQKNIFTPFFTTKSPGEGTGLGLSITDTIIGKHNGKIIVKSRPNEGTKVQIYLPIDQIS